MKVRQEMALIACDIRYGRTDRQKRWLAGGSLRLISEATGEPRDSIVFAIQEGAAIIFVEHGEHRPEYVTGAPNDPVVVARRK